MTMLEDLKQDIQEQLLEYHRAFVMAGRSDIASAVANCLDMVLKAFKDREERTNDKQTGE